MVMVKWDPWQDMLSAQRDVQRLFSRMLGDVWSPSLNGSPATTSAAAFAPPVEVLTKDGDLVVRAEVPGIDPEQDVDISLTDNVLTIRGERRRDESEERGTYVRQETMYGAFQRQFVIPEHVTAEDIRATYRDGILEVVVPKAATAPEPKKIPVRAGSEQKALTTEGAKE